MVVVFVAKAQVNLPQVNPQPLNHPYIDPIKSVNNKMISCTDTVRYPESKLTGLPEVDTMDISTYIGAVSQAYHFSGNGTISGISAYVLLDLDGVPFNSSPIIMTIKVYNIDANNYPTTMIDSADVQVMDVGFQEQKLMFTTPVAVNDSFAISMEINAAFPANPYYVTNTSANNDGNMEKLSCATYLGVWYNAYIDFAGWDMDVLLAPVFNQTFSSSYTVDTNLVCLGNTVTFTNTTLADNNPMFHPSANTYSLDLGDFMTVASLDTTYTHLYMASGSYSTVLTSTQYGYTANCVDMPGITVTVLDTAIADFGYTDMGGGVFQFSDSSMNATTWSWDFGDGSPINTSQNPMHTYSSPGNYQVCLSVSGDSTCNVNMYCDSVSFTVDIDDFYAADYINIFPIPASKYFNVTVPSNYYGGQVVVTDVVGKKIKVVNILNQERLKVLTDEINSGVYFVSIDYNGERVFTKRIVIDK